MNIDLDKLPYIVAEHLRLVLDWEKLANDPLATREAVLASWLAVADHTRRLARA